MDSRTETAAAQSPRTKARETGIFRAKFEMTDGFVHLWMGPTEAYEAGPGAEEGDPWSAQHADLDTSRVVAVKYVVRGGEGEPPGGWDEPYPEMVTQMRKIRSVILDALEACDDVTSLEVVAGGDGRAEFRLIVDDDRRREGRQIPNPVFARLIFHADQFAAW